MDNAKGDRMDVFTVIERGEKSFWVKIGSAFVNRDASLSVVLEALRLDGRLQVRPAGARERDEEPSRPERGLEHDSGSRGRRWMPPQPRIDFRSAAFLWPSSARPPQAIHRGRVRGIGLRNAGSACVPHGQRPA